jgi:photosystem II stability/assembly factor-like uncharacterized protein
MKKILIMLLLLCSFTVAKAYEWEYIPITLVNNPLIAIDCYGKSRISVCGVNGVIRTSTDAGKTWNSYIQKDALNINAVKFISPTFLVAVGDNGTMLISYNSGNDWREVGLKENIDFVTLKQVGNLLYMMGKNGELYAYDVKEDYVAKKNISIAGYNLKDISSNDDEIIDCLFSAGNNSIVISKDYLGKTVDSVYIQNEAGEKLYSCADNSILLISDKLSATSIKNGEITKNSIESNYHGLYKKPIVQNIIQTSAGYLLIKVYDYENDPQRNSEYFSLDNGITWHRRTEKGTPNFTNLVPFSGDEAYCIYPNGNISNYKILEYENHYFEEKDRKSGHYNRLSCLDRNNIIVAERNMQVKITDNGGKSWRHLDLTAYEEEGGKVNRISSIEYINKNTFVVCANIGSLVDMTDSSFRIVYDSYNLFTKDGGQSFEKYFIASDRNLIEMDFDNTGKGVINGDFESYTTYDYGRTVDTLKIPAKSCIVRDIRWQKNNTLMAYCMNTGSETTGYFVAVSDDFGKTWKIGNDYNSRFEHIEFANKTTGYAIDYIQTDASGEKQFIIYKTTDAGNSWQNIYDTGKEKIKGEMNLAVLSENEIIACGTEEKIIISTDDGGINWNKVDNRYVIEEKASYDLEITKDGYIFILSSDAQLCVSLSKPVSVEDIQEMQSNISISPNPISKGQTAEINIISKEDTPAEMKIFDLSGDEIHTETLYLHKGSEQSIAIASTRLNTGVYFAVLIVNGEICSQKKFIVK